MAAPGEGPKPVEAKKVDAPVAPDKKAPDQAGQKPPEKAAATPPSAQEIAAKAAERKNLLRTQTDAREKLGDDIKFTPDANLGEAEKINILNKLMPLDGKINVPYTNIGHAKFSAAILEMAQKKAATLTDPIEKKNAPAVLFEKIKNAFQAEVVKDRQPALYPLFANGAPDDIRVDVTLRGGEPEFVLNQDAPNMAQYQKALKAVEDSSTKQAEEDLKAKGEQVTTEATEQQKKDNVEKVKADFEAKYPQGMGIINALCQNDKEKVDAAFAGTGFLGFVLGLLGFGTGKGLWDMLSNNKTFAPYVKDIREKFDSMLGGVNDIDKPETFAAFYQGATPGLQKRIEKKFHTKASLTLPVDMKVKAIQFKADAEVRIADGTLKKFEAGKSYENEEFKKGATFPPETDFADVTVTVPEQATPAVAAGTPGAAATGPGEKAPEKKDV
ncbi:hypothetical protein KAZ92_00300 [Candidatus Gracilibacteria bacterium]|nr:hypothetical protein [Candidatus Gracilibacteria bacterium]